MKCSKCGNEVKQGAKFCPNCGNVIGAATTAPTKQQVVPQKIVPNKSIPKQPISKQVGAMNMNAAKKSVAENGFAGYWDYVVDAIKHPGKTSDSTQVYGLITAIILAIVNTITVRLFVTGFGKRLYSISAGAVKTESLSINIFLIFGLFIGLILIFSIIGFGVRYLFGDVKENFLVYTNNFMHYAVSALILAIIGCALMLSYSFGTVKIALALFLLQFVILALSFVQSILQNDINYKIDKFYVVLIGLIIATIISWFLTGFVISSVFTEILGQYITPSELAAFKIAYAGVSQAFKSTDSLLEILKDPDSIASFFR